MTDTARLLLTAAALSAAAMTIFSWRILRLEPNSPDRLVAQLRFAQWSAVLLAAIGGISVGVAIGAEAVPSATLDVTIGVLMLAIATAILRREPRLALVIAAAAFVVHSLTDIAHRPGWLSPDIAPRWYVVGSAIYDIYIAAICYVASRR